MAAGNQGAGLGAAQQSAQPQGRALGKGLTGGMPEDYRLALEAVNHAMAAGASQKDLAPLTKRAQDLYTKYYGSAKAGANPERLPENIEEDAAPLGTPNPNQDIKDPYTGPYKNLLKKAGLAEADAKKLLLGWSELPPEVQKEYQGAMGLTAAELQTLLNHYASKASLIPQ